MYLSEDYTYTAIPAAHVSTPSRRPPMKPPVIAPTLLPVVSDSSGQLGVVTGLKLGVGCLLHVVSAKRSITL